MKVIKQIVSQFDECYPPIYYINDFELLRISSTPPEYQYNLKDHLGNVRVTFGTDMVDSFRATLETDSANTDRANFLRYDLAKRVNSFLFDHTNDNAADSTGYSQRLNGSTNEKIGLAKSFAVMPGDVIKAEVYAKYADPNSGNWEAALTQLMGYLASPATAPAGTIVDGVGYSSSGTTPLGITPIGHSADTDDGVPKAYLNYIFINKNFDIASVRPLYVRISSAAREDGSDVPHEKLSLQDAITEEGYVYVYLSNDGETTKEVYFDDFKITHEKLPIIQSQDYYPFGLTFNGYLREDGLNNPFQYNGKEMQDEGGLGWLDYGARMYMPELGRWGVVDPLAERDRRWSVYRYGYDNPMKFIDPDGMFEYSNGYTTTNSMTETGAVEHWQLSSEQLGQSANERQAAVKSARGNKASATNPPGKRASASIVGLTMKKPTPGRRVFTQNWKAPNPLKRPVNALGWLIFRGIDLAINVLDQIPPESAIIPTPMAIIGPNRLIHIFAKSEHQLEGLVLKYGSQEAAFEAVQSAANKALAEGALTPNASGILPSGDLGNIINVEGMNVRLIGGRIEGDQVIISSFSRKGL